MAQSDIYCVNQNPRMLPKLGEPNSIRGETLTAYYLTQRHWLSASVYWLCKSSQSSLTGVDNGIGRLETWCQVAVGNGVTIIGTLLLAQGSEIADNEKTCYHNANMSMSELHHRILPCTNSACHWPMRWWEYEMWCILSKILWPVKVCVEGFKNKGRSASQASSLGMKIRNFSIASKWQGWMMCLLANHGFCPL